jgi:RNA polymerase sigma factor (sigma-70 family)
MKIPLNKNYSAIWESFISHDNREALSSIYFDHYDLLFNFGLKHTTDKQIVEDSIQNTFSYFLNVRKKLGLVRNVPAYLFMSFRRQLFLDLKKQKKSFYSEQLSKNNFDYFSNPEQDLADQEDENQLRSVVKECINKLSAKQQEIIYLRYECDLSYEDISTMLDITIESCHKSIYRSIKAIRTEAQKIRKMEERLILFYLNKGKQNL